MTNTISDSTPAEPAGHFSQLKGDDASETPGKKDEALEAVQQQLAAAQDARREERFIWIVICVILVDVLWFRNATNAVVPIIVLLLELVVLFILAKRMGVEEVGGLFHRMMDGISRGATGN